MVNDCMREENLMFRPVGRLVLTLALAGGLLLLAPLFKASNIGGVAWAQAQNGFNNEYFNNTTGGGTVRLLNTLEEPTLCALIYVFRADEQLEECCGCPVTNSGGIRTIRMQTALADTPFKNHRPTEAGYNTLADNPVNGVYLERGDVKIIASLPNGGTTNNVPGVNFGCDPSLPPVTPIPQNGLREYGTAVNILTPVIGVTEHVFLGAPDPTLSDEDADLTELCTGIFQLGSGQGICGCGVGDNTPHAAHSALQ
jgi:hypothetical protein